MFRWRAFAVGIPPEKAHPADSACRVTEAVIVSSMDVPGYVLTSLVDFAKLGRWFGVMVIDEPDSFPDQKLLTRQVNVPHVARKQGPPTGFITLQDKPLHALLRAAVPTAVTYTKPRGDGPVARSAHHHDGPYG